MFSFIRPMNDVQQCSNRNNIFINLQGSDSRWSVFKLRVHIIAKYFLDNIDTSQYEVPPWIQFRLPYVLFQSFLNELLFHSNCPKSCSVTMDDVFITFLFHSFFFSVDTSCCFGTSCFSSVKIFALIQLSL